MGLVRCFHTQCWTPHFYLGGKVIVKGNLIDCTDKCTIRIREKSCILIKNNVIFNVYSENMLPDSYKDEKVVDYKDALIFPGLVEMHLHAPQFPFRGLGTDMELLDWLNTYTFPEEAKYKNIDYAKKAYTKFVESLKKSFTTRAIIFATLHKEATVLLMDLLEESGLKCFVGKVNMDRNSPDFLIEETNQSLVDTKEWLEESIPFGPLVKPIITPRFVPSCTSELMSGLGKLAEEYNVPIQSHLSENHGEIDWVASLHPESPNYTDVYYEHRLMGQVPTVMAHCIHLSDVEIDRMAETQTMVSHCPYSNVNLSSGIAPIRKLMKRNIPIGLGSDISGGHIVSMANVLTEAIGLSKMKWVEVDSNYAPLTLSGAFYMATKGGGKFFGKVGSFEKGCDLDALIIDDTSIFDPNERTLEERLERWLYVGDDRHIVERYVAGHIVPNPQG